MNIRYDRIARVQETMRFEDVYRVTPAGGQIPVPYPV